MDLNLLVKNSHDGSSALTFALLAERIACTNALPAAIAGAQRSWKISHTPNADERVSLAVKAIKEAVGYQEKFQAVAQKMLDTDMVDAEFAKIVAGLWSVDPDAEGKVADRKRETQAQVIDLYKNSPTLEGIRVQRPHRVPGPLPPREGPGGRGPRRGCPGRPQRPGEGEPVEDAGPRRGLTPHAGGGLGDRAPFPSPQ